VAAQLVDDLRIYDIFPPLQSAFQVGHSTEPAAFKVLNDILHAIDRGDFAALVLLDLSAEFDSADTRFYSSGCPSALELRMQYHAGFGLTASFANSLFVLPSYRHALSDVISSIPQRSALGPLVFSLHMVELAALINKTGGLSAHMYADNAQLYGSSRSDNTNQLTT
jgi:hypothetical protein